ncbi:class I SAM-dependent methyltransferase [Muriicola soli]|uniref:Class I SAM-dependent methyltransferase n=1 Tax=Muriicola soli TaxID=2507538 RepID=A0A411E8R6_9FLAO|nr:class I SAM-dependent methyltransferase [Muriicola soli]QBA64038.1 class I SAM-dependent methyltransferase [Muriicola soli]
MKYVFYSIVLILVFANSTGYSQGENAETGYTFRSGDPNGIGKWYMGREIAYVMGYQGINWLERPEREKEEQTSLLLENMDIKPDDRIADIGAGSGYHVFKMAPMAKNGIVYAVDIQDGMLTALRARKKKEQAINVEVIKGSEQSIKLAENSVDKVLMVDVYHEFSYPREMMASVVKALRDKGKLFLIEYRGEDRTVPIKKVHKMTVKQAVKELEAAGMKLEKNINNLPWQHCMIFIKK